MATELASAYLTLIPSLKGAKASIEKELSGVSAQSAGAGIGKSMASGLVGSAKSGMAILAKAGAAAVATAATAAAGAVGSIGKAALESYAEYEQLVGGVDKLFQDASPKLQEYAASAYETAGMSANQYREQATSFSAALINSLGGDTQKAADMADVAMRAMSDNVNTFGSNMVDVQNAFQGFSKQNFTMLDNLKLGYGGTQAEMKRLIDDANEYAASIGEASDLSIDSFADIVQAIELIQEKQHIAGTTAREAATTIEGSVGMAKAAWQNWVTELGKDSADMGKLTDQLLDSVVVAAMNIVPRLGTIFVAATNALAGQLPEFAAVMVGFFEDQGPYLGESLMSLFTTAAQMVMQYAPGVLSGLVSGITTLLTEYAPTLLQGALTMFLAIVQALTESGPQIMSALMVVLQSLVQLCIENAPAMLDAALGLVGMLLQALVDYGPQILQQLLILLASLIVAVCSKVGEFFSGGGQLVEGLLMGAQAFFDQVAAWFGSIGDMILGAVGDLGSLLWDAGKSVIDGFLGGLKGAWDGVAGWFGDITSSIPQLKGPPATDAKLLKGNGELIMRGLADGLESGWRSASGVLSDVTDRISNGLSADMTIRAKAAGSKASWASAAGQRSAAAGGADESGELVVSWLASNLPAIISEYTPVMGEKEFGRKARKAVAYA